MPIVPTIANASAPIAARIRGRLMVVHQRTKPKCALFAAFANRWPEDLGQFCRECFDWCSSCEPEDLDPQELA